MCNEGVENTEHMITKRHVMKITLFASQLGTHIPVNVETNSWILHWLNSFDIYEQLFCVLLWKVWNARNQMVFKNIGPDPIKIAQSAMEYIDEYNLANFKAACISTNAFVPTVQSEHTPCHRISVGAGCLNSIVTSWGLIISDMQQQVTYAATKKEQV